MRWLTNSLVVLLSAAGWLMTTPQSAHGQIVEVWAWRNLGAPLFGGPWIAPDIRFRPLGLLDNYPYGGPVFPNGQTVANSQTVVVVNVPDANASVWVQGQLMRQTGTQRVFVTPPLEFGYDYTYDIRARWSDDERTVEQTRTVAIRAGDQLSVDFARSAKRMPFAEK